MFAPPTSESLDGLRETLRVMEEDSHLGLDNEAAEKLRQILLHQIERAERSLVRQPDRSPNVAAILDDAP
jgi:hypothetical protein